MNLYKRFLLVAAAVICAAGAVCGVLVAGANTERRLLGTGRIIPTAAVGSMGEEGKDQLGVVGLTARKIAFSSPVSLPTLHPPRARCFSSSD